MTPASGEPPDEAFASALATLPEMTPQRLRRILGERSGRSVYEELLGDADRVVASLMDLASFSGPGGRPRGRQLEEGAGAPAGLPPPALEVAGDLERRRARILEVVSWWRSLLQRVPVQGHWSELAERGITVIRRRSAAYPARLERAASPPELLYLKGGLEHVALACVGVVGTRRATHYGREVALGLGRALAESGVVVVSGLARGIDAAAHEGALAFRQAAPPLGVAGSGVDVVFPEENRRLWARVVEAGGVVSESPPGARPEGWRFPLRNRIIAALSQVLVVVESSRQGGAMHTVAAADAIGVPVLAIPGSIRSPQSEGTNGLIRDGGAGLATDVDDVLAALALAGEAERSGAAPAPPVAHRGRPAPSTPRRAAPGRPVGPGERATALLRGCSDSEQAVYGALEDGASSLEQICRRTGLGLGAAVLALDRLEELGLALQAGSSWVRR